MDETPEKIPLEFFYESPEPDYDGMSFYYCPAWFNSSGLIGTMGYPKFSVLKSIIEYDICCVPDDDIPFWVSEYKLKGLISESSVSKEEVENKIFPELKEEGFIEYGLKDGQYRIKLNWDKLIEVYGKLAYSIPFERGGLENIPPDFTGIVRPTPLHSIMIVKGKVV